MLITKNLALGNIINAIDASPKKQEIVKASSNSKQPLFITNLKHCFMLVDANRDELQRIYDKYHSSGENCNPRGAGRKPWDVCFMFKLLMIQIELDLSDAQLLYQVSNRLDLLELLGVEPYSKFPCASTVWGYREMFAKTDIFSLFSSMSVDLLETCTTYMKQQGIPTDEVGKIASIDATHIDSYWRRDSKQLNDLLKSKKVTPEEIYPNPNVRCQKDTDAQVSSKYGVNHFGYKATILVDAQTRMILSIEVTPGNTHDVKVLEVTIDKSPIKPQHVMGDSGYIGKEYADRLKANYDLTMHTCQHIPKKCSDEEKEKRKFKNRLNSAIRKNVEHCFFTHKDRRRLRQHGLYRASFAILMYFLLMNIKRAVQICSGKCRLKTANQKLLETLILYFSRKGLRISCF